MSHVVNVIAKCSLLEEDRKPPTYSILSDWFSTREKAHPGFGLVRVDGRGGGFKAMECVISIGAFTWFDLSLFLAFAWSLDWSDSSAVQIMIQDQEDERFKIYGFEEYPKT